MPQKQVKSIEYCLDAVLRQLYENWNDADRNDLQAEELLKQFGLPQRHEFLITIVDKLIKDGKAALIDANPAFGMSMIDVYQSNCIITVDGYYFVQNGKSYKSNKKRAGAKRLPENIWWAHCWCCRADMEHYKGTVKCMQIVCK